ncbi:hypothetical protein HanIR_Chr08g0348331 [Helianthus annuus]|nr:hypothetical protein HanIR_Chr08g0348331 [Helianthus annuus]
MFDLLYIILFYQRFFFTKMQDTYIHIYYLHTMYFSFSDNYINLERIIVQNCYI